MKRELLLLLMRKHGLTHDRAEAISRHDGADVYPLSFAQQRLWFLSQYDPHSPAYIVPVAVRLKGPLNVAALGRSIAEIARRHEILRTVFATVDGEPRQVVRSNITLPLAVVELRHLAADVREAEVLRHAEAEARQPFDLATGPLLRITLLRLTEDEYVLLLTMHHIISDGWSMGVWVREVAALYAHFAHGHRAALPELPVQYGDFALWQRAWLQGANLIEQLAYWKGMLAGAPHVMNLPTDRPRPQAQSFRGVTDRFIVSAEVTSALRALSQRREVTLYMTLLAAFQTFLYHYTAAEDFLIGTALANRDRAEIEPLIGFFVNTVALRCDLSGDPSFLILLERVREITLGAYAHQNLPFEQLVAELQPERTLSHTPLFQVMFILQNAPLPPIELPDLALHPLTIDSGAARFDLELALLESGAELEARLTYSTDIFDAATAAQMAEHFKRLLQAVTIKPELRLLDLAQAAAPRRGKPAAAASPAPDLFNFET